MTSITVTVDPSAPLEVAVAEALKKLGRTTPSTNVLVLPPLSRPGHNLVEVLARGASQLPAGSQLILVHPSTSLGFLLSTAALRLPKLKLRGASSLAELDQQAPPSGEASDERPDEDVEHRIACAFEDARRTRSPICVVDLVGANVSRRTVTEAIVRAAVAAPSVRSIYLVNPAPICGFIASSVGLRLPTVSVRAIAERSQAAR